MPSQNTSYTDDQMAHILRTKGEEQGFSDRVQELVDKGIEVEEGQE